MTVSSAAFNLPATTPVLVSGVEADSQLGQTVAVFNNTAVSSIFLGGADVTVANGMPVPTGMRSERLSLAPGEQLWAVAAAASTCVALRTGL